MVVLCVYVQQSVNRKAIIVQKEIEDIHNYYTIIIDIGWCHSSDNYYLLKIIIYSQ